MQIRHIGLLLLFLLLAVFAIANWSVVTSSTDLNLLLGRVQAPFGLLMLVTVAAMGCIYAVMLLVGERRLFRDNMQLAREVATVREQAQSQIRTVVAEELSPVKELLARTLEELQRRDDEAARHEPEPNAEQEAPPADQGESL